MLINYIEVSNIYFFYLKILKINWNYGLLRIIVIIELKIGMYSLLINVK